MILLDNNNSREMLNSKKLQKRSKVSLIKEEWSFKQTKNFSKCRPA